MLKMLKILTFWRFAKFLLKIEHKYISESCRGEDYLSDGVSHMSEGLLDIAKGDVPDTPFLGKNRPKIFLFFTLSITFNGNGLPV